MVRINWTFQAKKDLKSIAEYISKDSKMYAKRHVLRLKERVQILKKLPKSGTIVSEISDSKIRELIYGNYRIIYKLIDLERIDILTVHHSSRDLTKRNIK